MKSSVDLVAILTIVAGIAGSGLLKVFGDSIDVWAPGWGTKTVAVLSSVSLGAGLLVYIINNRTPTNTILVHDQVTGNVVPVKTVAAPVPTPPTNGVTP